MPSQVLSEQTSPVRTFIALVRAHAAVTRRLSVQLTRDHGLTINDYEVLLRLARAPDRRMRRVDLAEEILLTPSGITRLLDGLERVGYVERGSCDSDRRVVYAVLTDAGLAKLREASKSHVAQIDELFTSRFGDRELVTVSEVLERLGDVGSDAECEPPE
jgi:DNA-binding MarR family transcriptional regulator